MRTYRFDHFKAEKPAVGKTSQGGANPSPPVEPTRPQVPPSEEELHYGRQHARTAELYQRHREERKRTGRGGASRPREEPLLHDKAKKMRRRLFESGEVGPEELKRLAREAVSSVLEAAKEAARGRPIIGARKLASDTVSGMRRVAREVSARTSRAPQDEQRGDVKEKGPGKKR